MFRFLVAGHGTDECVFFFFKQKTAYEMTCDWSSDVCSSDLIFRRGNDQHLAQTAEHKRSQRVTDHWFVVDREKLFADNLGKREEPRPGATSEENGLFVHWLHCGSNSAHSCQKLCATPRCLKSIPIFCPSNPTVFRGLKRNPALSNRNELLGSRSNLRSLKRPPLHLRSALTIQFCGNSGRGSIVALTLTLAIFCKMRAHTRARELVAWTCETFFSNSGLRNARAKRACRRKIPPGARCSSCARSSSNFCARVGFARHSASMTISSGKSSSCGAICSIFRVKREAASNSHTIGTIARLRRFISSTSRSRSGKSLSGHRSIRYAIPVATSLREVRC